VRSSTPASNTRRSRGQNLFLIVLAICADKAAKQGLKDVCVVWVDGWSGFFEAIQVYPRAQVPRRHRASGAQHAALGRRQRRPAGGRQRHMD